MMKCKQEAMISVNGIDIAYREWGDADGLPVVALHGWLDNSASFDHLLPLLEDVHVYALDLAGHGHSGHRPPPGAYNIWDDLLDILAFADAMGWQRFNLIGHSRGAIIATLLSAAVPERVEKLLLLDGLVPHAIAAEDTAEQIGKYLRDARKARSAGPVYANIDEAVEARCKSSGMTTFASRVIVERALYETEGGFRWRSDSRLRDASALKLTQDQCLGVVNKLQAPTLLLLAEKGAAAWPFVKTVLRQCPNVTSTILDSTHHLHIDDPELVAERIHSFFFDTEHSQP